MLPTDFAFGYAILAGLVDVAANLAATKSDGFSKPSWGILSILLAFLAFTLLVQAIDVMNLAVAYTLLGATGIFGTAIASRILLGIRLKPIAWVGFCFVLASILVLQPRGTAILDQVSHNCAAKLPD